MSLTLVKINCPSNLISIKCPYTMTPEGVTMHNTSNKASARAEISYMLSNKNQVSYHAAVDDKEAVQGIDFNRNTWNSGDGANGKGNRKTIAVEICYSTGTDAQFEAAEKNGAIYAAMLLKQYGWTTKNLYKHQDWSGKYCPHKTLDKGWSRFVNMVQEELDKLNGKTSNQQVNIAGSSNTNKEETYKGYLTIIYTGSDGVSYHTKPSWSSSTVSGAAKKGTVLTVVARIKVDGVYMYKLDNGKYITSSTSYVKFSTSKPATSTFKEYTVKVANVAKNDVLHVRKSADANSSKVTSLKHDDNNLYTVTAEKKNGSQTWLYLKEVKGYVNSYYTKKSTATVSVSYYAKCASKYTSLVDALNSIKVDSTITNRKKIAKANGISNYAGSSTDNTKLLNLLKQGKLKKA